MGRRAITGKIGGFYLIMGVLDCGLSCVGLELFQVDETKDCRSFCPVAHPKLTLSWTQYTLF